MRIGDIDIAPVLDGVAFVEPSLAYGGSFGRRPETPPEGPQKGPAADDWAPHRGLLNSDGKVELALGGFLVRSADRTVLVDTGAAVSRDNWRAGRLLDELAAIGVSTGDVTDVVLTHLHWDHVGWTTRHGEIVFENAVYRCDERDWSHFVGPDEGATKKLSPLAGRLEPWRGSGRLLPGMDTLAAPGHTPGSTIIIVSAGAERAMLLGDVVHCPVELLDEEWAGIADVDPVLARRTRNALARELEGTDTPVAAAHFPGLRFGRLLHGASGRSWVIP